MKYTFRISARTRTIRITVDVWFSSDRACRFRGGTLCFLPRPSRLIRPSRHLISHSTLCSPSYWPWCYTDCTNTEILTDRRSQMHSTSASYSRKYRLQISAWKPASVSSCPFFSFFILSRCRKISGYFKLNHDEFRSIPFRCCLIIPPFYVTIELLTVSLNNRK